MGLVEVWFVLIAVLWTGYFFLEGFDFGVGALLPVLGRTEARRRVLINTIGPVWDGNEVWVIVAGAAVFAAFPEWYATLFSGFYLPLLVILLALIVRGVAFEYRGKHDPAAGDGVAWRRRWDAAIVAGSVLPAFLWGVAFANIVRGVHIGPGLEYTGGLLDLLNAYSLLGGVATLGLFTLHGAVFLALKTSGEVRVDAGRLAVRMGGPVVAVAAVFVGWTQVQHGRPLTLLTLGVAAVSLIAGVLLVARHREGWAFVATGTTILTLVASLFLTLYPDVMPATDPQYSLTVSNASSSHYTLVVMTWVAACATPFVLAYQGWTYWVFRKRLGTRDIPVAAGAAG